MPVPRALSPAGLLAVSVLAAACQPSPDLPAPAASPLCFERRGGQPGSPDLEQLRLQLDGAQVAGTYGWYPWQKDRRVGSITGRLASADTARVTYRFSQEGQQASAALTILFSGSQARIRWDPGEQEGHGQQAGQSTQPLPPPVLLRRQACAAMQAVPAP